MSFQGIKSFKDFCSYLLAKKSILRKWENTLRKEILWVLSV